MAYIPEDVAVGAAQPLAPVPRVVQGKAIRFHHVKVVKGPFIIDVKKQKIPTPFLLSTNYFIFCDWKTNSKIM